MTESFANIVSQRALTAPEIDKAFLSREISSRIPGPKRPTPGISLPEQAQPVKDYWKCHGYLSPARNTNFNINNYRYEDHSQKKPALFRMGAQRNPPRTRRAPKTPPSPHSIRPCGAKTSTADPPQQFVSWKYFGYTDGICGCFSATAPRSNPQAIANAPEVQAHARLVPERKRPRKPRKLSPNNHRLFASSLTSRPNEPFQFSMPSQSDLTDQTQLFLETNDGRTIPLKSSSILRR